MKKPNILVIFTDDQGYADFGCSWNKKNKTPVFDKMAEEGTKFTDFYAEPVCGPSRSALLTVVTDSIGTAQTVRLLSVPHSKNGAGNAHISTPSGGMKYRR